MKSNLYQLTRAVGWGALVGGGPYMVMTLPIGLIGLFNSEILRGLYFAFIPLVIALAVTLSAAVLIGLPLTAILHHLHRESRLVYGSSGVLFGIAIPLIFLLLTEDNTTVGIIMALSGGVAGMTTGTLWGGWREKVTAIGKGENPPVKK